MKAAKEAIVQEKKEKNALIEQIRKLERTQNLLTKDMDNMKNALLTEIAKGEQFSKKAQSDRSKLYDEKKKRQQSNQRAYDKLKEKDNEISHLKQSMSTMSDEMKGKKRK